MKPKLYSINEIFCSLQGEGYWLGTPAIFIRFSGCNLSCDFCDTDHREKMQLDQDGITQYMAQFPSLKHVILTGGEPGLQIDLELINHLHQFGYYIQIETNGTRKLPDWINWVTVSPKENTDCIVRKGDELKIVYTGQNITPYLLDDYDFNHTFLQPVSNRNIGDTIEKVQEWPNKLRLSMQIHTFINIK